MTQETQHPHYALNEGEACITLAFKHNGQLYETGHKFHHDGDIGQATNYARYLADGAKVTIEGGWTILTHDDLRIFARRDGTAALQFARNCEWESLTEYPGTDEALADFSAQVERIGGGAQ